jgi:putative transposase
LRDLDQAWRMFFAGTRRRPRWRKAGQHEGLRIVAPQALRVRQDNRARSSVLVPKIGWVSFKRSRTLADWKSYRITRDRAGRWHIAFAVIPDPVPAPGTGGVVGVDRGVTVAVALSTGELTSPQGMAPKEAERLLRLQRRLARASRGSNRRKKVKALIGRLKAREVDRRKDWVEKTTTDLARRFDVIRVEKVNPAYTSQTCNVCKHIASQSRQSQATFVCVACGHQANADVNAARNIAAGYAVTARGDRRDLARSVKREPQHARPPKIA